MTTLAYDGSFNGLLTALGTLLDSKIYPEAVLPQRDIPPLFSGECRFITTDPERAEILRQRFRTELPLNVRKTAYTAFLSEEKGIATHVTRYLMMGLAMGSEVDLHLTDEAVHTVHVARRRVLAERHRLLGLIRFSRTGDFYYARIEPDTNVLELLGSHFASRFGDQQGLIHDQRRRRALLFQEGRWKIAPLSALDPLPLEDREKAVQTLWRRYFSCASVQGRENARQQLRYMPRRYWKHLVEDPEN